MSNGVLKQFASTRTAFIFIIGVALLPGIAAGVGAMALFQQTYFPIVDRFEVTEMAYDKAEDAVISGGFRKLYPEWACKYRDMNWFMPVKDSRGDVVRLRISARYADARPKKSNNNRYKGPNKFYGWTVGVSEYPDLREFTGYVHHTCLGVLQTRTYFPLFTLPDKS